MLGLISIFLTKYQSWPGKKPKPLSLPKLCRIVSLLVPCNVAPTFTCWVLEDTEVAQCHGQRASEAWWNLPFCSQNSGDHYAWNSSSVISTASLCLWLLKEKEQYHTALIPSEKKRKEKPVYVFRDWVSRLQNLWWELFKKFTGVLKQTSAFWYPDALHLMLAASFPAKNAPNSLTVDCSFFVRQKRHQEIWECCNYSQRLIAETKYYSGSAELCNITLQIQ